MEKEFEKSLPERLVLYRYQNDLTKIAMTKRIGVSYEAYCKWESGLSTPKAANLEKIEALLKD